MADETEGVKTLLGDPKKAVITLAIPIAIATLIQTLNNIIDAVWLAGVGTAALAATGVIFPYFFIMLGLGNGIGVGASQAIARRIGAGDSSVHRVAARAFYLTLFSSLVLSVVFFIFMRPLLSITGAGDYMQECVDYATPILSCGFIIALVSMFGGILRAEGDAKKAMITQVVGAALNIVLDPIFIFVFGWGVSGAAWATILSMVVSLALTCYWYFVKKSTFVRLPLGAYRFDREIDQDILKVGIPGSLEFLLMSATAMVTNMMVLKVSPTDGIAVFTTGWRILELLEIPTMAIGFAIVPVCAAAYGAREFGKMKEALVYGLKLSLALMLFLVAIVVVAAPDIVYLFTYSGNTAHLSDQMVQFLRICCVFMPLFALGLPASCMFQALGKGVQSLCATLVLNVLRLPFCYVAMVVFGTFAAVTWGMAFSEMIGSVVILVWALLITRAVINSDELASH